MPVFNAQIAIFQELIEFCYIVGLLWLFRSREYPELFQATLIEGNNIDNPFWVRPDARQANQHDLVFNQQ